MALPRCVRPGTPYLLTRRCYQRTFRLRPSEFTNELYEFCLAVCAEKYGILIHAACVMSNHHHVLLTDVYGCLPDFVRDLHRMMAKALNAAQGQWENLWSAEPYHVLELPMLADAIDKVAYIAANPVEAGLVESPEQWPGVMLLPSAHVRESVVSRPTVYFDPNGVYPETATLRITPLSSPYASAEEVFERVEEAIERSLTRAREAVVAQGRGFLGRKAVLGQSFQKRAESFEPKRGPVPIVRSRNRGLVKAILERYAVFRVRYRELLVQWRGGKRDVVFPFGTWAMGLFHGARVEAAPAPA